ncbi:hypothetical protein EBU91_03930, partial [bacterium]|nr:hypothetical protein [bacterium]
MYTNILSSGANALTNAASAKITNALGITNTQQNTASFDNFNNALNKSSTSIENFQKSISDLDATFKNNDQTIKQLNEEILELINNINRINSQALNQPVNSADLQTGQVANSTNSQTGQVASNTDSQIGQAASDADNALSVRANGIIQLIEDLSQILQRTISAMENFSSRVEGINKSLTSLIPLSSSKVPQLSQASNDVTQSNLQEEAKKMASLRMKDALSNRSSGLANSQLNQAVNENDINITSESSLEEIKSRAN